MESGRLYEIIYADPPWYYDNKGVSGNAHNHYSLLTEEQLKRIDVKSIAAPHSTLFMWATMPKLPDCISVMEMWGFRYCTVAFTWIKCNKDNTPFLGTGFYTRANPELCLLGVRGATSKMVQSHNVPQLLIAHRGVHSQKPYSVYHKIVELLGDRPRVELFARDTVEGWDSIGIMDGDIRKTIGTVKLKSYKCECNTCGFKYDITVQEGDRWFCPNCGDGEEDVPVL